MKEALKMALEALEAAYARLVTKCEQNLVTYNGVDVDTLTFSQEAITAIKEALAQPEQEPVAKAWDEGYRQGVQDERISEANIGIAGFGAKVEPARQNPYGTTPPQRKPLTDEEINRIAKNYALSNPTTPLHFARAIEAAHGIKGEA